MPLFALDHQLIFSAPKEALTDPNGLLAIGDDLSVKRLCVAYQQGIFSWFDDDEPILWWLPDPRAILLPEQFHVNRTFKQFLKQYYYHVTINHNFDEVIVGCANHHDETWITEQMIDAYRRLHQLGFAHSVEVWQNNTLIGGVYGVAQGTLFCGESMFSLQTNAFKVALYTFCQHFSQYGGQLIDCQVLNDHTKSLGAFEITRDSYLLQLSQLQRAKIDVNCYRRQSIRYD